MRNQVLSKIHTLNSTLVALIPLSALFGGGALAQVDCVVPPPGLVSWWRAENGGMDETGNNAGTLTGDVTYGVGRVGQAFVFNGSYDAVSLGNPSNLQLQTFTIEAWIKRASTTQVSLDPFQSGILFSYAWGGYGFAVWDDGRLFLTKNGTSAVYSTLSIADTNWHHVAVAKSGSRVVFYLDGVGKLGDVFDQEFVFAGPVAIGARGGDFVASFLGAIDELSVYNRALSDSEVLAVYGAGTGGKCVGLVAPRILAQPESRAVQTGTDVTFSVRADGTMPLSYQWVFNGTEILGATATSFTVTNAQLPDAGAYAVRVINPGGQILSSNAVLIVVSPPPCSAVPSGLVGWWRGEDSVADGAGINDGTLFGQTAYAPGRVGRTLVFDGLGDGVSLGNATNLHLQTFSIEAWVKRASVTQASLDIHHCGVFLSYGQGGYGFAIWDDGRLFLTQNGSSAVYAKLAVTDTQWHHVAVTKLGSAVTFCLDGVSELVAPYDPGFIFRGPVAIGGRGGDLAASFLGCIDELSIYNRALSTNEVQAIYNAGSAGKCLPVCIPHLATATAEVVNGFVVGATITDGGCGYTNTPTVRIIGDGKGAQAVAVVSNGVVTAVKVQATGAGYTKNPSIVIKPPFVPQPTMGGTLLLSGPFVTSVIKLALANLSPYDSYQLEFRAVADGAWSNFGPPFSPTATTTTVDVNAVGDTGFFRLKYVP